MKAAEPAVPITNVVSAVERSIQAASPYQTVDAFVKKF